MEFTKITDEEFYSYDGYDGVDSSGTIHNLDDYVKDRYGSKYKKHKSKSVTSDLGETQFPLSVYVKDDGKYLYSEGNCGLVSVYNHLLYFYNKRSYNRLPATNIRKYNPSTSEPNLYRKKKADGNYIIYDTEDIGYQKEFSQLYIDARLEAYRINGGPEGLTVWESRDILNNIMSLYDYSRRFKIVEIWSTSTVTSRINDGEALLWSTLTGAYGSHTMFVSGYNIYVKETKILLFTVKTYKDFLEIRDGWSSSKRYFDFNGLNNGTLLGAFVVEK